MTLTMFARRSAIVAASAILLLPACQKPMQTPTVTIACGDFTTARLLLHQNMTTDRGDRRYLLDRMRVGVLTLDDGLPSSAQTIFVQVYEVLRSGGINRDKTVASVVLNEDLKIWKGEPFEQALAMAYYAMTQAELGSWDNARAAAGNSLFYLRDFGTDRKGKRIDTYEIARRSLIYERAIDGGESPDRARRKADYLNHGYVVRESNFTLGYLIAGIANQQLDRDDEAADHFNRVVEIDPTLEPLTDTLRRGDYNTILIVSYGLGPAKEGYGPDNALARFAPRCRSDRARLRVREANGVVRSYPQALDANDMAADHMWNNLEDVRIAKSLIGSVLLAGGVIATEVGAERENEPTLFGGLGAIAAGLFLKAGSHVDVRFCDVMPQRFYVVPLRADDPAGKIELQVEGAASSRLVLSGLGPPPEDTAQLRYVRLLSPDPGRRRPPAWSVRGKVLYANPHTGATAGPQLPYLLGGRCVRPPTERVLDEYQRAGHLRALSLADLRRLYHIEGIWFTAEQQGGYAGRHVLDGGTSLVAPLPGTTGFARLFGRRHWPYQAKSKIVAATARREAGDGPDRPSPAANQGERQ